VPIYRGTIVKHDAGSGEQWSNVYNFLTSSASDALATLQGLFVPTEQSVTFTTTLYDHCAVVNVANRNDRKAADLTGQAGALTVTGLGGPLPLYVTTLVTFADSVKRPERKFLRGAYRNNLANGVWSSEWVAFVNTNYASVIWGELTFVGPSGERPTSFAVSSIPTDRQLGWHRRTRPGFRRGWVPV
jgi:hypothetical protein